MSRDLNGDDDDVGPCRSLIRGFRWGMDQVRGASKKFWVSVSLLCIMWIGLIYLPSPYNSGLFSIVSVILATDYSILKTIKLQGWYGWIQSGSELSTAMERKYLKLKYNEIARKYRAKKFNEDGPNDIDIQVQQNGDLRARIQDQPECISEDLEFRIYVKSPYDDDLEYNLRIATANVTNLRDAPDGTKIAFLTIIHWENEFEDNDEMEVAEQARQRINQGEDKDSTEPFARLKPVEGMHRFDIAGWKAIQEWAEEELAQA